MNVVHVSPTYYSTKSIIGGGEKYIIYMIRALGCAATQANESVINSILAFGEISGDHVLNGDIHCRVMNGIPWDPHSIRVEEYRHGISHADVVVVHQSMSALGLFLASHAQLNGKYVVGMDHGGGEYSLVSHTHEGAAMYNAFFAQSEFASNAFVGLGVRTSVIRGPVDTEYYCPDSTVDKDPSLVVAVGRLLPHKGFDRIIKSMPPELKLVIAGSRSDEDYISHLDALRQKSGAQIEILDGLDDRAILELLRKASLFVHASTHTDYRGRYYPKPELLGLAPLEALACGTPTLVSTAGALAELAVVDGCRSFGNDGELAAHLIAHANNSLANPTPEAIHKSVDAAFGMEQFGTLLLSELKAKDQ